MYEGHQFVQGKAFYPIIIALCKFTGAVLAELGTAYFMLTYTSIESVIGGYVKFSIVANVGNIMALTLTNIDIGGEIGSKPVEWTRAKTKVYDDIELTKQWKK